MYYDSSGYFRQLYPSDLRKLRHHNEIPGRVGLELVRAGAVRPGRDSGNRGFFEISEMATVSLRKTDYASARGIRFGNYAEDMAVGRYGSGKRRRTRASNRGGLIAMAMGVGLVVLIQSLSKKKESNTDCQK